MNQWHVKDSTTILQVITEKYIEMLGGEKSLLVVNNYPKQGSKYPNHVQNNINREFIDGIERL